MRSKWAILKTYGKVVFHQDMGGASDIAFMYMAHSNLFGRGSNKNEALDKLYSAVRDGMFWECGLS